MLEWLIWQMPWWLQVGVLVVIVGVPVLLVTLMIWGPKAVAGVVLPVLGAILTLGLASRLRQQGYQARLQTETEARRKAEEVAAREEAEARRMSDEELPDEVNRWTRK